MSETNSPLSGIASALAADPAVLVASGGGGGSVAASESVRAVLVASLARTSARLPIVVAVPRGDEAVRVAHDISLMLGDNAVEVFPAWETLPFERVSPALDTMGKRLRVMWRLRVGGDHLPRVIVAPVRALVQRLGPHVEDVEPVVVTKGSQLDRDELLARLINLGYRREYQVEARGEVAVRGSIIDVYPTTADHPVRIDLFGDEVDRLSHFSVADQRSTEDIASAWVFGARELLPTQEVRERAAVLAIEQQWGARNWERLAEGAIFDGMESWLPWLTADEHLLTDLLPPGALVLVCEPRRLRDRAQELLDEEAHLAAALAPTWGVPEGQEMPRLSLEFDRLLAHTKSGWTPVIAIPDKPDTPQLLATPFDPIIGDSAALSDRLRSLRSQDYTVLLCAEGRGSADRIAQLLADEGVTADVHAAIPDRSPLLDVPGIHLVIAPLDRGVLLPAHRLALVSEADLTGRRRVHRKPRGARKGIDFYDGMTKGDYVVHRQHGVGRYEGMVSKTMFGLERDYLLVAFRGEEKIYVPTDQIGIVRKYTGGETPKLSKMGGSDWEKERARVRKAVRDVAGELVVLYRRRLATPGHAFAPDTPWQSEVEDAFPYEETPDQQTAIDETKADMERSVPMDRLVCGDVGFGKTEVALRAVFKCIQDSKQAAILVPTTLLASQHGQTFRERFANYPVRVEVVSRFLTAKEQKTVLEDLADGRVDLIIGTHRLLSEDVHFKNLGLLVVDEEQRFGVMHKERIKQFRAGVDVLTLSATPIPRTLELSLTGIRDLSLVNTPPEDRMPILTYVDEFDERAVTEAIRRELLREGQVLYVHNRVRDIQHIADDVRRLVPEARVAVAHGQMDEGNLEKVVTAFWERDFDVLVCTTIVESGLDMPTVNTLVVDRADLLGLSQLYQLRGRVGRRGQRAYAYLLYPRDHKLSDEAYERLKTIGEFTDLGSGFKIAMRDLEIRGAGNLLGAEQSGQIAAVGFDMYMEMVTEAVGELTGVEQVVEKEVSIDVGVDAHLPRSYVERDDVRMEAYRRLAAATTESEVADLEAEWTDRYGEPPSPAAALLAVARLRVALLEREIRGISVQKDVVRFDGWTLKKSQEIRLKRFSVSARVTESVVQVPFSTATTGKGIGLVAALLQLLAEIAPLELTPVASPAS